ncbi:MAG: OmpP1/FadL family transporter, partial [Sphingobium sp.]
MSALPAAMIAILGVLHSGSAHAGGFMLQEQSQVEIGRAFSGAAASADTPSTIYYNPAGMTELDGIRISAGAAMLFIDSHQSNQGSTRTGPPPIPALAIGGGNGGNPFASIAVVPTNYASVQVSDRLWLGFGINAPFGLKLDYAKDFFGRYDSLSSNLLTLDAQPSFAYKLNDTVSIGGGIDVQYVDVTLKSALPNLDPAAVDGMTNANGDDISLGWNAGILLKLRGGTRFGLHYRSRVKHDLKGTNINSGLASPLAVLNSSLPIRAPLTLPDSATASLTIPLDGDTQFMATGRYYNWSLFQDLKVVFPSGAVASKHFGYRDSWSLSLGLERRVNDRLTLRGGGMFDRTPTNPS